MGRKVLIALAAGVLLAGGTAQAATIRVTTTADQYGLGGKCALREAVEAANTNAAFGGCPAGNGKDTILLKRGKTYRLNRPEGALVLMGAVRVKPVGKRGFANVSHNELGEAAFWAQNAGNRIERLRIRKGHAAAQGGALIVGGGAALTLRRSVLANNRADNTGGAVANFGTLRVSETTISGNQAIGGGAIFNSFGATLIVNSSTIVGNRASGGFGFGGGISVGSTVEIRNSTISKNRADGNGGGIEVSGIGAILDLRNVTITRNRADADGVDGGIGGGVSFLSPDYQVRAANSIVAGNRSTSAPDCGSLGFGTASFEVSHTLLGNSTGCDELTQLKGNIVGATPRLGPLRANGGPTKTHALRKKSPAVNRGSPAKAGSNARACLPRDQRGVRRPRGKRCDMGAFEK